MITVTGSLAFDYIMDFKGKFADNIMPDKIHQLNVSFLIDKLQKQRGGNSGNIAYSLALLQTPSSILSTAGNDFSEYNSFLGQHGIDTSHIRILADKPTATAFIMTDLSDNQISAFYPGAMSENISLTLEGIKTDFVCLTPDTPEAMYKFAKECQELNIPYMLDSGMQLPALESASLKEMISGATILIVNDYELNLLKEKSGFSEDDLLKQVKILITTLGEKGSLIQAAGKITSTSGESKPTPEVFLPGRWQIKAGKPKEVVDPTGAGDAYRGGFLAGYLKGLDLKICGQMGSIASCYAIEKYGTTNHKFSVQEFCERYKENFGTELEL